MTDRFYEVKRECDIAIENAQKDPSSIGLYFWRLCGEIQGRYYLETKQKEGDS